MASSLDNTPKVFGEGTCNRCSGNFPKTGLNQKRCEPCRLEHKRQYERENKRASHKRLTACSRCGVGLPHDIHAHTRYCEPCAPLARVEGATIRYAANPQQHREYGLRHYQKERDSILERHKNAEWREASATRKRRRLQRDPSLRLHANFSRIINLSLNGDKGGRAWQQLVGYTLEDLRRHLERQFLKGMTWENYGPVWHVDHITARTGFKFITADEPDFKACWALSNLRPLWSQDNVVKGQKRTHLL